MDLELMLSRYVTPEQIEALEAKMLEYEQTLPEVVHHFAPGIYMREARFKEGTLAIGMSHRHDCMNVVLSGRVSVVIAGHVREMKGGDVFVGKAFDRKVGYIHEDSRWLTIHPTNEIDIATLEEQLLIKSPAQLDFERRMKAGEVALKIVKDHESFSRTVALLGYTEQQVEEMTCGSDDLIPLAYPWNVRVRPDKSSIHGIGMFAAMEFDDGVSIAPARIGMCRTPLGRYTNHSATPNCEFRCIPEDLSIGMFSLRQIGLGEELTVDYGIAKKSALELDALLTHDAKCPQQSQAQLSV